MLLHHQGAMGWVSRDEIEASLAFLRWYMLRFEFKDIHAAVRIQRWIRRLRSYAASFPFLFSP
jgi:hypothetical protein